MRRRGSSKDGVGRRATARCVPEDGRLDETRRAHGGRAGAVSNPDPTDPDLQMLFELLQLACSALIDNPGNAKVGAVVWGCQLLDHQGAAPAVDELLSVVRRAGGPALVERVNAGRDHVAWTPPPLAASDAPASGSIGTR